MRRILLFLAFSMCGSFAAQAQAPNPWVGPYFGVHLGLLTVNPISIDAGTPSILVNLPPAGFANVNGNSALLGGELGFKPLVMFGAQTGYNWMFSKTIVVGFEADISGLGQQSSSQIRTATFQGSLAEVDKSADSLFSSFGTVRGRVGYLLSPSLLIYGTGGLAFANVNSTDVTIDYRPAFPLGGSQTPMKLTLPGGWRTGYAIGGGLEYAFTKVVTVKLEGLYYDLGKISANGTATAYSDDDPAVTTPISATVHLNGYIGRVGLNYHF